MCGVTAMTIVKVDRIYRRNLFGVYILTILVGVALVKWVAPVVLCYVSNLPNKERVETLEILKHLALLLFIPPALYLIHVGKMVCTYKAMPYPGMRVIHDTKVVTGKQAIWRGRSMIALGVVLIVMVVGSIAATHLITLRFKHHPLFRAVFYGNAV